MKKSGPILRKSGLVLLLLALTVLVMIGCGTEDSKPSITRLYASATCGVAPLRVDFRGDGTGGAPFSDPTGGNNWLRMQWDFGDGTVISDGTSIAFHQYAVPDTYTVTLTVEDNNGDRAARSTEIIVQADSLGVDIYALLDDQPATEFEACQPLQLGIFAETCGFDPIEDSYERFVFLWTAGDSIYRGTNPQHTFSENDLGSQEITVTVEDPTRSITRWDTLLVDVIPSPGADLTIAVDWLKSPQGTASDVLDRDVPTLPDTNLAALPDTLVYTVRVANAGPADAYNLTVVGTLDPDARVLFYDSAYDTGDFEYVAFENSTNVKRWTWIVPEVAVGAEAAIDIYFYVEAAIAGSTRLFPTELQLYACDPDPTGREVTATLNIVTVPPPPP